MSDPAAPRCSDGARERGDQMVGTAPPARRWFLVEQNGDWGRSAWEGLHCYPQAKEALQQTLDAVGARLMLIRRPGARPEPGHPTRRWYAVDTASDRPVLSGTAQSDGDLVCAAESFAQWPPEAAQAAPADDPGVVLVCTHGLKDVCCAVRGRPVAAALADLWPDAVWETTHTGGDRFAANIVLLPAGAVYGGTDPDTAVADVRHHVQGRVDVTRLRGRAGLTPQAQAAHAAVLKQVGPARWDDVVVRHQSGDRDAWAVDLDSPAGPMRVTGTTVATTPHRLTCRAVDPAPMHLAVVQAVTPSGVTPQ